MSNTLANQAVVVIGGTSGIDDAIVQAARDEGAEGGLLLRASPD